MIGAYFTGLTWRERRDLDVCHTCGAVVVASHWEDHLNTHPEPKGRNT